MAEEAQTHHEIYEWIPLDDKSQLPEHALLAGKDHENDVFVGRGAFDGGIWLGKYHSKYGGLYVGHKGKEEEVWDGIEILCVAKDAEVNWVDAESGYYNLPPGVIAGTMVEQYEYFVGRGVVDDAICPGRISWGTGLHASYGGKEEVLDKFQALVIKNADPPYGWTPQDPLSSDYADGWYISENSIAVSKDVYVGRVSFLGKIRLTKVSIVERKLFVAHAGRQEEVINVPFEILELKKEDANVEWQKYANGEVPAKATLVTIVDGHAQFVGRGNVGGEVCVGAIVPADGGKVETLTEYEALVIQ